MNWMEIPVRRKEPDFENLLAVLRREVPKRPALFEFTFNGRLYSRFGIRPASQDSLDSWRRTVKTF